jgi:hypothetical protein
VEIVVGFVCIVLWQVLALKLRPMRVSSNVKAKSFAEVMTNSDYATFNHRGKFIADRLRCSS